MILKKLKLFLKFCEQEQLFSVFQIQVESQLFFLHILKIKYDF